MDSILLNLRAIRLATEKIEEQLVSLDKTVMFIGNTCFDCLHWDSAKQECGAYKQVPPPRIIAGKDKCPNFDLHIPF